MEENLVERAPTRDVNPCNQVKMLVTGRCLFFAPEAAAPLQHLT